MTEGEFSAQTDTLLDRAGAICQARGARLTDLRRQVLGLILDAPAPTGAYDLLDQLRATRHGAAPPTVYRALRDGALVEIAQPLVSPERLYGTVDSK